MKKDGKFLGKVEPAILISGRSKVTKSNSHEKSFILICHKKAWLRYPLHAVLLILVCRLKLKKKADLAIALLENLQRVRLFGHSLFRFFVGSVGRMIGRLFVNLVFSFSIGSPVRTTVTSV